MLKKVLKKMWDNLHLLRSRSVILPAQEKITTLERFSNTRADMMMMMHVFLIYQP